MKKILILCSLVLSLFILPMNGYAEEESNTITVYLFRGDTCAHCHEALEYISNHREEIPEGVEIVTYEVWENGINRDFHNEVAERLGIDEDDYDTVPCFVVGEEHILGYSTGTWDELFDIARDYQDNGDYKDIVEEVNRDLQLDVEARTLDDLYSEPSVVATIIVYSVFGVIILGFVVMIVFSRK